MVCDAEIDSCLTQKIKLGITLLSYYYFDTKSHVKKKQEWFVHIELEVPCYYYFFFI